jgi:hypothetical protein
LIPTIAISSEYRFGHFGLGFTHFSGGSGSCQTRDPKSSLTVVGQLTRIQPSRWSRFGQIGSSSPGQNARRIALPAAILVVGIQAQATFRFCDD